MLLIDTFNRADPVSGNRAGATWARPRQNAGLLVSAARHGDAGLLVSAARHEISGLRASLRLRASVCPGAATAAHVHEERWIRVSDQHTVL